MFESPSTMSGRMQDIRGYNIGMHHSLKEIQTFLETHGQPDKTMVQLTNTLVTTPSTNPNTVKSWRDDRVRHPLQPPQGHFLEPGYVPQYYQGYHYPYSSSCGAASSSGGYYNYWPPQPCPAQWQHQQQPQQQPQWQQQQVVPQEQVQQHTRQCEAQWQQVQQQVQVRPPQQVPPSVGKARKAPVPPPPLARLSSTSDAIDGAARAAPPARSPRAVSEGAAQRTPVVYSPIVEHASGSRSSQKGDASSAVQVGESSERVPKKHKKDNELGSRQEKRPADDGSGSGKTNYKNHKQVLADQGIEWPAKHTASSATESYKKCDAKESSSSAKKSAQMPDAHKTKKDKAAAKTKYLSDVDTVTEGSDNGNADKKLKKVVGADFEQRWDSAENRHPARHCFVIC